MNVVVIRLGAPANETINQRLNRFADKRRIQNTSRRFLEHLLLNDDLLSLVAGDEAATVWPSGSGKTLKIILSFYY